MESSFKNNLRNELNYHNMTVKELSAKTGIPKPTIDSYLGTRQTMPPADIALKIAKTLNVTVEYLLNGTDSSIPKNNFTPALKMVEKDLLLLDENTFKIVEIMIHALANHQK